MTAAARRRRRGWLPAALAGTAALCLGAGAHLLTEPARADVPDAGPWPPAAVPGVAVPDPVPDPRTGTGAGQEIPPRPRATAAPRPVPPLPALVLPPAALRVPGRPAAPVVAAGTDATGALDLPEDPATLAWWVGGALPGATRGTAVLAGHLDTVRDGPGVMAAVVGLPLGARLQVVDTAGTVTTYRITARRSYPKTALPPAVFASTGAARLVLVTCGGVFDAERHHYSDNVVVVAVPLT